MKTFSNLAELDVEEILPLFKEKEMPSALIVAEDPYSVQVLREYVRLRSMDHGMDSVCYDVLQAADAMQEYRERNGLAKGPKPAGGIKRRGSE